MDLLPEVIGLLSSFDSPNDRIYLALKTIVDNSSVERCVIHMPDGEKISYPSKIRKKYKYKSLRKKVGEGYVTFKYAPADAISSDYVNAIFSLFYIYIKGLDYKRYEEASAIVSAIDSLRGISSVDSFVNKFAEILGKFSGADAVVVSVNIEGGLMLSGFWSQKKKSERELVRGYYKVLIPIGNDDSGIGHVEVFFSKRSSRKKEGENLVRYLMDKLSFCVENFFLSVRLKERSNYFYMLYELGNLFRRASSFKERVKLALWALADKSHGFGLGKASYFIYDEACGCLRGFIKLVDIKPHVSSYVLSGCVFKEIGDEIITVNDSFLKSEMVREKNTVIIPLYIDNRLTGAFKLEEDRIDSLINGGFKEIIMLFAQQAALAFESAKLQETLKNTVKELSEAQKRFTESEKLASLGEFLARVVHDIKNPLVAVGGLAKRIYDKLPEDYPEKRILKMIMNETNRALSILTDVLSFVRKPVLKKEKVNVNEIIDDIVFMEATTLRDSGIVLMKKLNRKIPDISADQAQIRQVLLNLITNAIQAMEKGGTLIIRTDLVNMDEKQYVVIEITDTGGGIPPDIVPNIFNPFFTTKSTGTGLGLSTAKKIVELHGGKIEFKNNHPVGATFYVYLPVEVNGEREISGS